MRNRAPAILLALVALLFFGGIAGLLRMRFSRGDVYPVYSTFRADPLGTRALYESLQLLPEIRAQRWLRDAEKLPGDFHGTLIFAGMTRGRWEHMRTEEAGRLDALARGGARVVVAFTAGFTERGTQNSEDGDEDYDGGDRFDAVAQARATKGTPPDPADSPDQADQADQTDQTDQTDPAEALAKRVDDGEQWGVKLNVYQIHPDKDGHYPGALRGPEAPRALPATLEWMSEIFFEPETDSDWRALYTRQTRPVLIERHIGANGGSLVLAADSFFLSNEALQRARATALLAWLVEAPGGGGLVIFDERHLGLREDSGIAVLARRYGLAGAAFVAALFAALWAWRSMALFVPPAPEPEQAETGYDPTAGLEALLRRSIPKSQIAQACVEEWRKSASAAEIARVEHALAGAGAGKNEPPEKIFGIAQEALRRRSFIDLNRRKST